MTRRRWRITVLAALATLAAVYPVTSLFTKTDWLPEAALVIAVTAVLGLVLRGVLRSRLLITAAQLVLVLYFVLLRFTSETFAFLAPTPETVDLVTTLGTDAISTIQASSAPAPLTDGVTFWLIVAVALIAVLVDAMAATWRAPAAAGLPLLTAYLITASNGSKVTSWHYFIMPVVLWLVMLHTTARAHFGRWSTTAFSDVSGGPSSSDDSSALRALTGGAARLGALAVLGALVIPAFTPHLDTRYLLDGLGRGAASGGQGTVGFNNTVDLKNSLASTDKTPILRYTTTGTATTPLRVLATSFYSDDGEWSSALRGDLGPSRPVPLPPDRNRREYVMTVTDNTLEAPRLAAPHPVVSTNLSPSNSRIDPVTREVQVDRTEGSYEVTYAVPAPIPAVLRNAGPPRSPDILQADLRLPEREKGLILRWSEEVTSGESTDYDKAVAIQQHLRDSSRYTYNLDLGPRLRDENGRELDPLAQFYESRRGYCVQFATAMVMLSRAQGIPARLAIGFLPGSREDSSYVVRASNAHAWPELYFQGAGWVRFEPTANQSAAPPYSLPAGSQPGATTTAPTGSTNTASAPTSRRGFDEGADVSTSTETSWWDQLLTGRNLMLLISLLVVAIGTFLMPFTAWLSRSLRRRRAATRQDLVEIEWEALRAHLGDLGLSAPPGATLRVARERYITDGHLDTEHATAMRRVTTTLERARYDRPERTTPQQTEELHRDIRSIRRQVSTTRSWTTRLRSFLWPTEGVSVWRGLVGRVRNGVRRTKGA